MAQSATYVSHLERKLRTLRRNIMGVADAGEAAEHDDESFAIFQAHLHSARGYWEEFRLVWDQLDAHHVTEGTLDKFPGSNWEPIYDSLRDEIRRAEGFLIKLKIKRDKESELSINPGTPAVANSEYRGNLPKISIPHFTGDLMKWNHFKDTFSSLVHNDKRLSDVEKLHYLIGALSGEPATLISGLPVQGSSYLQAWNSLLKTYNNSRVLATLYVQKILDCDVRHNKSEYQKYREFLTNVGESVDAFNNLKLKNPSNVLLSILALRALDPQTRKYFELENRGEDFPSVEKVINFVHQRMMACKLSYDMHTSNVRQSEFSRSSSSQGPYRGANKYSATVLHANASSGSDKFPHTENVENLFNDKPGRNKNQLWAVKRRSPRRSPSKKHSANVSSGTGCPFCDGCHSLNRCFQFSELPVARRQDFAKAWKGCLNCLNPDHKASQCPSHWSCKYCGEHHHSLLHSSNANLNSCAPEVNTDEGKSFLANHKHDVSLYVSPEAESLPRAQVLMATAQVLIDGPVKTVPARILLDSGSQYTFITTSFVERLGAEVLPFGGHITGLGGGLVAKIRGFIVCTIRSPIHSAQTFKVKALVIDSITSYIPGRAVHPSLVAELDKYDLADPFFGQPCSVDALVGADLYPSLLTGVPCRVGINELYLVPTVFGQVVMGTLDGRSTSDTVSLLVHDETEIIQQLKAFWALEEPSPVDRRDPLESLCEEIFVSSHTRSPEGRYIVRLPMNPSRDHPGDNRQLAMRRFYSLENKLRRDTQFKEKYHAFMQEYIDLGHMAETTTPAPYIIPHHGVWQIKPQETKLRVVFDGSCPASNGRLNDIFLTGPKLQPDISEILINFRLYPVALTGDLVKMYRQVVVHSADRHLQHIFWRNNPCDSVKEYELKTVTYGLTPSAYLAQRVVQQLVTDEGANFPLASGRLASAMYVDDILTGAHSRAEALSLQQELVSLFKRGGFEVSKWASNLPEILTNVESCTDPRVLTQGGDNVIKILGLTWHPRRDIFSFMVKEPVTYATKRTILSSIARIFDPLGFLAPVVLHAKLVMQEIWKHGLGWDDPLPPHLRLKWMTISQDWHSLTSIEIPRYAQLHQSGLQLIGFSDASLRAYSACVYAIVQNNDGEVQTYLLKAKTKVAPTKFLSIAQLELCGALLLRRVMSSIVISTQNLPQYYTDSSVVLAWLHTPVHQLRIFEANRVSAILTGSQVHQWHFVASRDNPADIASRGCLPAQLVQNKLWWNGPQWITSNHHVFSSNPDISRRSDEIGQALMVGDSLHQPPKFNISVEWMEKFSTLRRLVRVVAWILRFKKCPDRPSKTSTLRPISGDEYSRALTTCARAVQQAALPRTLYGLNIPKGYHQLQLFVDEIDIIRVGGRLRHAPLSYDQKHPILLPRHQHFTRLVIEDIHTNHFHAGPTLTLSLLRNKFWIVGALKCIRSRIHNCVHCRRLFARPAAQVMGDLPRVRFETVRAFTSVGVDYAGPMMIRESTRRKASLGKAYFCVFICLSTKAIHIEAVSSLTTEAFLATLDRFVARRGLPACLYSDNATNFVGASRYLKDLFKFLVRKQETITNYLAPKGVRWQFIPPHSPHFGGLWEAGVKSVKKLLVHGKQPFTYEELSTMLTRIEGLLNSRPLCPVSSDPENLDMLTPGHFLIGAPMLSLSDEVPLDARDNALTKWEKVRRHVDLVWDRWSKEYLHHLQQRKKWVTRQRDLSAGELVLLLEKRSPIGTWPVARIVEVFPGKDGAVRVVSVKSSSGRIFKRTVRSLAPLLMPNIDGSPTTDTGL